MDKEDIFCYFLVEAILNTDSEVSYLYDMENNILFRIKRLDDTWEPYFYNENIQTELYIRRKEEIYNLIEKYSQGHTSISELKKINNYQKQSFVDKYINAIESGVCKDELKKHLQTINLRENEKLIERISGDIFLGIAYSRTLWLFLEETFKTSYYTLGIDINESKVYL